VACAMENWSLKTKGEERIDWSTFIYNSLKR
jgi:hypothetical protein